MLRIKGPAIQRQQYTRIPMTDGAGDVSAFVHEKYVNYRPKGGSETECRVRAQVIAEEIGGEYISYVDTQSQRTVHIASLSFSNGGYK